MHLVLAALVTVTARGAARPAQRVTTRAGNLPTHSRKQRSAPAYFSHPHLRCD
jgi:hypothetical protein